MARSPRATPVVVAADDQYAMQLAVAVRSLLDTLASDESVALYVLDGGISARNRERCIASWAGQCAHVEWIRPPVGSHEGLEASARFPLASYFRILTAELLPPEIDRVLFTDPDVLFLASPLALLDIELQGHPLAAVQDAYCPFVDNRIGMRNYRQARGHVYGTCAIPNVSPRSPAARRPYFNAGFLVMDLAMFRRERIGELLLQYCRDHRDRLLWADQCALNACLGGRWVQLEDAWNVTPPVFRFPGHEVTHYDRTTFERIRSEPRMVHFSGPEKPWHEGCEHPFAAAYWETVARTSWNGSRPVPRAHGPRQAAAASRLRLSWPPRYTRGSLRRLWKRLTRQPMDAWDLTGGTVATGPFRGMRYVNAGLGSVLPAKLLGTYERELHPWIDQIVATPYRRIHVIGCAEGYYAVGLARAMKHATIQAYDLDARVPAALADLAIRNGVTGTVHFHGEFTASSLAHPMAGRELIVCDVEGAEQSLLDPTEIPQLLERDLLVEIHDAQTGTIERIIESRFIGTHRVRRVTAEPRGWNLMPAHLRHRVTASLAEQMMNERRKHGLTWLLIERGSAGRAQPDEGVAQANDA